MPVKTNIVGPRALRKVQLDTLKIISDTISASFGPMGSNTLIIKDGAVTKYSKDGFTILKEMKFLGVIEEAVRSDMEDILRNIVKEFGDNSTSAAILSYLIFDALNNSEVEYEIPFKLIADFKKAVENINAKIMEKSRPCDPEIMERIAYISTNGNETLSDVIYQLYNKYPLDVHIDVTTSSDSDFHIKDLDGLTLSAGFMDTCFINNKTKNTATIRNASIYYFEDPIDTPEMAAFFDRIIGANIIEKVNNNQAPVPTVILCPKLSRDYSSLIENIVNYMYNSDPANRVPLLIVTNIYDKSVVSDIIHLCGCKTIKKFIDPKIQEEEIKKGNAPDAVTVVDFCGHADEVVSDSMTTKFINPAKMYDIDSETGERKPSKEFTALTEFIENEINRQKTEGGSNTEVALLTKRLKALNSNLVELYVGGISAGERDSYKDLIEDAILNCRSAATYGYGYGANYEGLMASKELLESCEEVDPLYVYYKAIYEAYKEVTMMLYSTVFFDKDAADKVQESIDGEAGPYNLRTDKFDGLVLTSIKSDVTVLNAIARVMTIMFTSNQALLQNPVVNNYETE